MIQVSAAGTVGGGGTPHSRIYFPSTGAAAVSPSFSGSWNITSSADRLACVTTRISSAMASKNSTSASVAGSPSFSLVRQYVSAPLTAQTISGTVKGQARCQESSLALDATPAIHIRVVSNDGSTVRGTILALSAADQTAGGFEMDATALANRSFRDSSESATLTLSSLAVQDGDRLVIEIGFRQTGISVNATRTGTFSFGDDSATDLIESDTSGTTPNNPWVEFSSAILFQ